MAKYLLVGLILLAGLASHPSAAPPAPVLATAWVQFETSSANLVTRINVRVQRLPGASRIGLGVLQRRESCAATVCEGIPLISGAVWQEVRATDALVDRSLAAASAHLVLSLHDDVSGADLPVRLDVAWIATGPARCGFDHDTLACLEPTVATVDMAIGPRGLALNQTVPDGWIRWSEWSLPTSYDVPTYQIR